MDYFYKKIYLCENKSGQIAAFQYTKTSKGRLYDYFIFESLVNDDIIQWKCIKRKTIDQHINREFISTNDAYIAKTFQPMEFSPIHYKLLPNKYFFTTEELNALYNDKEKFLASIPHRQSFGFYIKNDDPPQI